MIKKSGLVVVLLFACASAQAALQYEFQQVTRSDVANLPSVEFSGRAVIDGDRSRIDFVGGNAYTPGTYIISTNGSRTMFFVDPMRKVYAEINAGSVAAGLGASNLTVDNLTSSVNKLEDHPLIAGVPTDHYRLTLSYDISLTIGAIPLKQTVRTTIDKWTTVAFGDVSEAFLANSGIRTGNEKLDQIINIETTKVKGFPLREATSTVTTDARSTIAGTLAAQGGYSRTRTQTREMLITAIRQADAASSAFTVPTNYTRAGSPEDAKLSQTQFQTLSMEPK
jgi:hypothetical protein